MSEDLWLNKRMIKDLSKASWHVCLLAREVARILVLVVALQPSLAFAQTPPTLEARNSETSTDKKNTDNKNKDKKNTKPPAPSLPPPIPCPTKNPLRPTIPPQSPLPHTVLLTWKASADSARIAGYCLYRRENPKIPATISDCLDCQLVSEVSLATNGCVDDRVENDKTYYYVVVAAVSATMLSRTSNEATAKIPRESSTSPAPSSYPLCRPTESVKTEH